VFFFFFFESKIVLFYSQLDHDNSLDILV